MLRLRKVEEQPLFDSSLFAPFYKDDFFTEQIVDNFSNIFPLCKSIEEFEIEYDNFSFTTTSLTPNISHKKPLFQNQQFLKLQTVCHAICESASSFSEERFETIFNCLNDIADVIRSGCTSNLSPPSEVSTTLPPPSEVATTLSPPSEVATTLPSPSEVASTLPSQSELLTTVFTDHPNDVATYKLLFSPPEFKLDNDSYKIISKNEMLTDEIMDSACYIFSTMFPNFRTQRIVLGEGLYRPVSTNDFGCYAQIHHLMDRTHYVLSVLLKNEVLIYDSLPSQKMSTDLQNQLQMLYPDADGFFHAPGPVQTGSVDCGIFCLANLYNVLSNFEVSSNISYCQKTMRKHLIECLKSKQFSAFSFSKKRGAPKKPSLIEMEKKVKNIGEINSLDFVATCTERGAPKKKRQRRYDPKFNNK